MFATYPNFIKLLPGQESELSPDWEAERGHPVGACHLTRHSRRALVGDVPSVSVSLWLVEPILNLRPLWVILLKGKGRAESTECPQMEKSGVEPAHRFDWIGQQNSYSTCLVTDMPNNEISSRYSIYIDILGHLIKSAFLIRTQPGQHVITLMFTCCTLDIIIATILPLLY